MPDALMVIDMLNGFCNEKGSLFVGPGARSIIPFIAERVQEAPGCGKSVIFMADSHAHDDPEFKRWPPHCIKGSWESSIVPEIPVDKKFSVIIPKTTLSSFYNTTLEETLRCLRPEVVEVVGVCTNICILYAVFELRCRNYDVTVYKNGTATFDSEIHEFALGQMEKVLGAKIV